MKGREEVLDILDRLVDCFFNWFFVISLHECSSGLINIQIE